MEKLTPEQRDKILADIKIKAHRYDDGFGGVTDQVVKLEDVKKILNANTEEEQDEINISP